jgi:hypothetical protein
MDRQSSDALDRMASATNFLALMLVLISLGDYVANVWPFRLGEEGWRYGAVGLLSGFLVTPLLGAFIGAVMAILRRRRVMLTTIAVLELVTAAILVIVCLVFVLDAIALRSVVRPDTVKAFDVSVVKALGKHLLVIVTFGWLGFAGLKAARVLAARQVRSKEGASPLVVGTSAPPRA